MGDYFFIDFGTNTLRLMITNPERLCREVEQEIYSYITGFGRGLASQGKLSGTACLRTLAALRRFRKILDEKTVKEGVAFATESLRKAMETDPENTRSFLAKAKSMGFSFRIISGEEESVLSFRGALKGMDVVGLRIEEPVVFDIGGGSTEFSDGNSNFSLKIGSVMMRDIFSDPAEALEYAEDYLAENLESFPRRKGNLIGVAGTVTTLASVLKGLESYRASKVQGSYISLHQMEELFGFFRERYLKGAVDEIASLRGMEPKRASVIPFGTALVLAVLRFFGAGGFFVSDWSVLQGMAIDYLRVPLYGC